jgi:TatD DNase family protein
MTLIDAHCHFDMLPSPEDYIQKTETAGNITIGMTNLPSHFEMGYFYMRSFHHVRLALGFHPLLASENQHELQKFILLIDKTSYIGEIGLDFSKEGYSSKDAQIFSLRTILNALRGKNKIISVHSRRAEDILFDLLKEHEIRNVIFHWYTGRISLIQKIIDEGYYFSINEYMITSMSGRKIISAIPKDRILTETDAPFNDKTSIKKVLSYINITEEEICENFNKLLQNIK